MENKEDGRDKDNDAEEPRLDEADVPQESDYSGSGRGVIGDPVAAFTPKHQKFLMEVPIATSTPKAFTEHALNQGKSELLLWTENIMMLEKYLNHIQCLVVYIRNFGFNFELMRF